ncbi:hypothetical protein ACIRVF_01625 [Kitasatospora sp. NPDC101157]|uniref:hypothetical protein n=1 Tax=Kitasatospora sp. NPDC101157 TaxID=3364098 RepID=UPI00382E9105
MANDQSETPVPSMPENSAQTPAPAAAVEAGQAVEGAVNAASNPTEYTEPSADRKNALESELFGDEADHVVEPAQPATGEPGKTFEPENVVAGHP